MEYIYAVYDFIVNAFNGIFVFFNHLPDFFMEVITYISVKAFVFYIDIKIYLLELFMSITRAILDEYGIYTIIEVSFNKLPANVQYALSAFGIPQGFRIIFDAYASSLLMRFVGR